MGIDLLYEICLANLLEYLGSKEITEILSLISINLSNKGMKI